MATGKDFPAVVDTRCATLVVAASNSLHPENADYQCDGVNDHVEIQAALDALPATGGEVKLLDGTYNCEAQINLDFNQTLRGCGRNTILTTSTASLVFLSAVGGAGTELIGITVADLQIDGGAGTISNYGIYFEYVDYSTIQNVYSQRHAVNGIYLLNSDFNQIASNTCQGNGSDDNNGIYLNSSNSNTISGNTCQGNVNNGIRLYISGNNTISGNTCQGNQAYGICLYTSDNNTVSGNTCQGNYNAGIYLPNSNNNTISGNTCVANSQVTTNTADDIFVAGDSDYNNIQGNTCRAGALVKKPRYGINISTATCDGNLITNNDLYDDGFGTAPLNDAGTLTTISNNRGVQIAQEKNYAYVKNTSGEALAAGDVVTLKAVAAGNEITTTVTAGDQLVFGMVAQAIEDTNFGYVQVKGKTVNLKVDGTTDIAIGDLIGTSTTAKIGMKAASGKMAFAVALEAYTNDDSNGVIDALIITPRQAV